LENFTKGIYKETKIELKHTCDYIISDSPLGVIVVGDLYEPKTKIGFSIYSKTSWELLYSRFTYEGFYRIKRSKNCLILEQQNKILCLYFRHSFKPKESIELEKEFKLWDIDSFYISKLNFEYPYAVMTPICCSIIDVRTGVDILENIEFPKNSIFKTMNERYLVIEIEDDELQIFELNNLKKPIFKVVKPEIFYHWLIGTRYMLYSRSLGLFESYNLVTMESTRITKKEFCFNPLGTKHLIEYCHGSKRIYQWNQDYSEISLIKEINDPNCTHRVFESVLPCTFVIQHNIQSIEIRIYSNRWNMMGMKQLKNNRNFTVDKEGKFYYIALDQTLCIIDFSNP